MQDTHYQHLRSFLYFDTLQKGIQVDNPAIAWTYSLINDRNSPARKKIKAEVSTLKLRYFGSQVCDLLAYGILFDFLLD
jgi:hypothetical protein